MKLNESRRDPLVLWDPVMKPVARPNEVTTQASSANPTDFFNTLLVTSTSAHSSRAAKAVWEEVALKELMNMNRVVFSVLRRNDIKLTGGGIMPADRTGTALLER